MSFVHKTRLAKQITQTLAHSKCPLHKKWFFFFLCVHLKVPLKFDPVTLTPIHIQVASSRQATSNPSLLPHPLLHMGKPRPAREFSDPVLCWWQPWKQKTKSLGPGGGIQILSWQSPGHCTAPSNNLTFQ